MIHYARLMFVVWLALPAAATHAHPLYRVVPLSNDPAVDAVPLGINELGEVVGERLVPLPGFPGAFTREPFLWRPGLGLTALPPADPERPGGTAHAINDSGVAAGDTPKVVGRQVAAGAVHWPSADVVVEAPNLGGTYVGTWRDVNDAGLFAGVTRGGRRAAVWSEAGGLRLYATPRGSDVAALAAVNNSGVAVGSASDERRTGNISTFTPFAAVWDAAGEPTYLPISPPGVSSAPSSRATDINDHGDIAGSIQATLTLEDSSVATVTVFSVWPAGDDQPTIFTASSLLGVDNQFARSARAEAINDHGVAVGSARGGTQFNPAQFLGVVWSAEDGALLVGDALIPESSSWSIAELFDINNRGVAVGYGYDAEGNRRGVMLVPVPEPQSFALAVVAFVGVVGKREPRLRRPHEQCNYAQ